MHAGSFPAASARDAEARLALGGSWGSAWFVTRINRIEHPDWAVRNGPASAVRLV